MGCFRNICHWRLKSKTPLKISSLAARKVVNIKNEKTVATNLLLVEFSSPSKLLNISGHKKSYTRVCIDIQLASSYQVT